MDINVLHRLLGHAAESKIKATAKEMEIETTGKLQICKYCKISKAKKKKIAKTTDNKSTVPCGRLYIDLSTIKTASIGNKRNWILVVDEATNMKWSIFTANKDD